MSEENNSGIRSWTPLSPCHCHYQYHYSALTLWLALVLAGGMNITSPDQSRHIFQAFVPSRGTRRCRCSGRLSVRPPGTSPCRCTWRSCTGRSRISLCGFLERKGIGQARCLIILLLVSVDHSKKFFVQLTFQVQAVRSKTTPIYFAFLVWIR